MDCCTLVTALFFVIGIGLFGNGTAGTIMWLWQKAGGWMRTIWVLVVYLAALGLAIRYAIPIGMAVAEDSRPSEFDTWCPSPCDGNYVERPASPLSMPGVTVPLTFMVIVGAVQVFGLVIASRFGPLPDPEPAPAS